ncbi:MAG: hypothetical protein QM662_19245 [Gordonia sp. (in: high G+C Gram-positive bacteria)]
MISEDLPVTLLDVTVGTADFRRALASVLPHASTDQDFPQLCRVRVWVDTRDELLYVGATDRYTAALAVVSVWQSSPPSSPPTMGCFDLGVDHVKKILAVFKTGRESLSEDLPEWSLRVELRLRVEAFEVRVTDVSGLPGMPGEMLESPTELAESFPDLRGMFARWITAPQGALTEVGVAGKLLTRFVTAARTYGEPLILTATEPLILTATEGAGVCVRCGDSFLGFLAPRRAVEDDPTEQTKQWLADWVARLPAPTDTITTIPEEQQ